MMEEWKDVKGFEGRYQVSNHGRIKSFWSRGEIIMKPRLQWEYPFINLRIKKYRRGFHIHRLVAQAFVANPENKPVVNHKNGIKTDNSHSNLEWVTIGENIAHAHKTGLLDRMTHKRMKQANPKVKSYGVRLQKGRYVAAFQFNKKSHYAGSFSTEKEAAIASDDLYQKLLNEYLEGK